MKNIISALFAIFLFANSCTSQTYVESGLLSSMIEKEQFTFMAERVNITNMDVMNTINSIPGASAARMQDLDYGYDIVFENKELNVHLPYFGRAYNAPRDASDRGYNFTSKDYSVEKKEGKKGKITLTVKPNDVKNISAIYIEIEKNGKAYVSINSNDRQPISFSGYIKKNEIKKEKTEL